MPSSRQVARLMRQPCQRAMAVSIAASSPWPSPSPLATSSAKWRPRRLSRKSRTPSGEASVFAAIIALAAFQACIGSAPARSMVP